MLGLSSLLLATKNGGRILSAILGDTYTRVSVHDFLEWDAGLWVR